jgi:hypothetical protein
MKTAVILMAMAGLAAAETRTYDIRATQETKHPESCGATKRMMKDKHVMKIKDDGRVFIDGMEWQVQNEEPDSLVTFHMRPGQHTYLMINAYVSTRGLAGKYIIVGLTPKREKCFDVVYIDGKRR